MTQAILFVNSDVNGQETIKDCIKDIKVIHEAHITSGSYNLILKIGADCDEKHREDIIKNIRAIAGVESIIYYQSGLKAYIREGRDDYQFLFVPREEKIHPHLQMNKGEVFVDVGANVGYYSLKIALANRNNDVKVVAIEAHPETYSALLKNIECNDLDDGTIVAVNKAVADKKRDDVVMYERYTEDGVKRAGNSSICITFDNKNSVLVQCDTLDNILANYDRVDVLKMDIEGAETMALIGASTVLKKLRKIVIEIHGNNLEPVISILEENGFVITRIPYDLNVYVIGTRLPQQT